LGGTKEETLTNFKARATAQLLILTAAGGLGGAHLPLRLPSVNNSMPSFAGKPEKWDHLKQYTNVHVFMW